jgi:hypothetical protein
VRKAESFFVTQYYLNRFFQKASFRGSEDEDESDTGSTCQRRVQKKRWLNWKSSVSVIKLKSYFLLILIFLRNFVQRLGGNEKKIVMFI